MKPSLMAVLPSSKLANSFRVSLDDAMKTRWLVRHATGLRNTYCGGTGHDRVPGMGLFGMAAS